MSDPYLSVLPYHKGEVDRCLDAEVSMRYLIDTSAVLVGRGVKSSSRVGGCGGTKVIQSTGNRPPPFP